MGNQFGKAEKLCGALRIADLYKRGKRMVVWPLRITYMPSADPTQVLIWAPKSLFHHAVDRNRLRRQMREAYRLNKAPLEGKNLRIAFNYMDKAMQPYDKIEQAMVRAIQKICEKYDQAGK